LGWTGGAAVGVERGNLIIRFDEKNVKACRIHYSR
jgi:hypothetical protein